MFSVLFIHDREDICFLLSPILKAKGYRCVTVSSPEAASTILARDVFDIVILDIDTFENPGDVVSSLLKSQSKPDILITTNGTNQDSLEISIRAGAWDALCTPFSDSELLQAINRCLFHRQAKRLARTDERINRNEILGTSLHLERCLECVATVAGSNAGVLVLGETGTGKELFARAIHENSPRAKANFIVVDCTNLPKSLAESLLFGHERGSFTGASETREGLFKQADGGTIFLDEIGDLDLEVQKSLLRVLHDRRFRPLSSKKEITSDFRLVAATNRNLEDMVRDGLFRKDLYHRLCNRVIHLPPLRERKEDIQPIATHYVQAICDELECMPKEISHDLLRALTLYDWPGNVRELINTLRATVHNGISEHRLYPQHLPIQIRTKVLISAKDRNASEDYLVISGTQKVSAPDTMSEQNTIKIFDDDICAASGKSVVTSGLLPVQHPEETADQLHNPTAENDDPTENSRYIRISIYNDHAPQDGFLNLRTFRELAMREVEFAYLKQLLSLSQGNFQRAQQLSGLSRARLYDLLSKHAMTLNSVNAQARASATDVFAPR